MKKALCFSGGGIKAFAHIGALKALEEKNFKKDIKMPIAVPAVNLQNGEVIIFSSKEIRQNISDEIKYIVDAPIDVEVRSSCGFPVVKI